MVLTLPTSPAVATGSLSFVQLADVKSWLGITDTTSDTLLTRLLTSATRRVLNDLDRGPTLGYRSVTETRDGTGTYSMSLRFWPVLSVSALTISGTIQNPQVSPPFGSGYFFDPWLGSDTQGRQSIWSTGILFDRLPQNVTVTYDAGYYTVDTQTTPTGTTPTLTTTRPWYSDEGVFYTSTAEPLTYTTSATPSQGQYTIINGVYTFNTADANTSMTIAYSYTPEDLYQAIIDVVSWHYKQRERIGINSKSILGQETISFQTKIWNDLVDTAVQKFRNVTPL